jgi:hypothetical protein
MDNPEDRTAQVTGPDGHVVTTTYTEGHPSGTTDFTNRITSHEVTTTTAPPGGRPTEAQLTEMRSQELAAATPTEKPTRTILDHLVTGARNLVSRMQPPERRTTEPAPSSKPANTSTNPA